MSKNPAAVALGKKGGKVKSKAKTEANRRNWLKALEVLRLRRANGAR
jgi:hypothetical protein